jgi:hypothetical protein
MSKQSWLKEFYPIAAEKTSKATALNHCIRKWTGLLPENLKKHNLEQPPIEVSCYTCALCAHYESYDDCYNCPLQEVHDWCRCDYPSSIERMSPWKAYCEYRDPKPMLAWLLLAKHLKK